MYNSANSVNRFEPTHHRPGCKCEPVWSSQIPQHVTVAAECQLHVLHSKGDLGKALLDDGWKSQAYKGNPKEKQIAPWSHQISWTSTLSWFAFTSSKVDIVLRFDPISTVLTFHCKIIQNRKNIKEWHFEQNRINDHRLLCLYTVIGSKFEVVLLGPDCLSVHGCCCFGYLLQIMHWASGASHGMSFECYESQAGSFEDPHTFKATRGTNFTVLPWCSFCSTLKCRLATSTAKTFSALWTAGRSEFDEWKSGFPAGRHSMYFKFSRRSTAYIIMYCSTCCNQS